MHTIIFPCTQQAINLVSSCISKPVTYLEIFHFVQTVKSLVSINFYVPFTFSSFIVEEYRREVVSYTERTVEMRVTFFRFLFRHFMYC